MKKIIILFCFLILLCGCKHKTESIIKKSKYNIHIGNWFSGRYYECESYKRDGNTYSLYDEKGGLILEITISSGYTVFITKNK